MCKITVTTFAGLTQNTYKNQAEWFLNGVFDTTDLEKADQVYEYLESFVKLDESKRDEGHELDEFNAHRLLEKYDETMTIQEMRTALNETDLNRNNKMSLIEFLTWKYQFTTAQVENFSQGDNKEEIEAAQALMDELNIKSEELQQKLKANQQALEEQKIALHNVETACKQQDEAIVKNDQMLEQQKLAIEAANYAKTKAEEAEATLKITERELQDAVNDFVRIECEYKEKMQNLEKISTDENLGVVKRNRAANELDQLKAEDPLPLRKAKITQEACLRKATSMRKTAAEQTVEAEKKKQELEETQKELETTQQDLVVAKQQLEENKSSLEQAKQHLEQAQRELEIAFEELETKLVEAAERLTEVKSNAGTAYGSLYIMERQMFQADKYLPTKRQKYDHTQDFKFVVA